MDNRKIFFIVTWNNYPEGDAGAVRQHAFAQNLKDIGYRPIIIGMGKETGFNKRLYDRVEYYSLRFKNQNIISRILGRVLFFINVKKILRQYSKQKIAGILIVSGDKNTFKGIEKYATKNNISLYHDSVEWYSESEFKLGAKDPAYKHNNAINTRYINGNYKVFAISSYLTKYFNSKNIKAIRVPVIMDVKRSSRKQKKESSLIRFLYAGHMGSKDRIETFIKAVEALSTEEQEKIQFDIVGTTYEQYKAMYGSIDSQVLDKSIYFRGRISREEVMDYLSEADFTILLRPANERYTKAGFPTKVVESLSMGVPVVCNLTSDLGMYLINGENSVLVKEPSTEECKKAIQKICSMDIIALQKMQKAAYQTAIDNFDRANYLDEFRKFLEEK